MGRQPSEANRIPDFSRAWEFENNYFLTCDASRIAKVAAHYELFKRTTECHGAIVECGVFKGASLARFAALRDLLAPVKRIVAFDIFGAFPDTGSDPGKELLDTFTREAGSEGASVEDLTTILKLKGVAGPVELVAGDICSTVPRYGAEHPELRCSLINLDTDMYEPALVTLETLYPRLVPGGVLIADYYGIYAGETKAVDEFFAGSDERIEMFPFSRTPAYLVK